MNFSETVKNIFFLTLLLSFAPPLIKDIVQKYQRMIVPRTKVGVISINGVLYNSSAYNEQLHTLFKDKNIKAILIKMECPGSAAGTGQAIHNEIKELKKEYPKPIVTLVENMCASGGYYIASATDFIIAPGCALVGSIGTALPYFFQLREFIEQFKIKYVPLKAGTYKNATDPFVDLTPEESALLQGVLNDSYQQFSMDIAHNRQLAPSTITQWADGKIFSGRQALKLGLIDEIGSAHNALRFIREKAIIEGEIEWIKQSPPSSFMSLLSGQDTMPNDDNMFSALLSCGKNMLLSLFQQITVA